MRPHQSPAALPMQDGWGWQPKTLLFPLVTGLLVSFSIWFFELSPRVTLFLSIPCMLFTFFTTTLPLSLKRSSLLFPQEVACGSWYCRRCIVLLVVTLVLGGQPMFYCHFFGGLVCLKMCLLLFGVVLFSSTQSLALKHPQVYCTLSRFPANVLRHGLWILSLTYPCVVDSMGFILVLISWLNFSSLSLFQSVEGALLAPWGSSPFLWACCATVWYPSCGLTWLWCLFYSPLLALFVGIVGFSGRIIFGLLSTAVWADWMYSSDSGVGCPLCYGLAWGFLEEHCLCELLGTVKLAINTAV